MKLRLLVAFLLTAIFVGSVNPTSGATTTPNQLMKSVLADADAEHSVHITYSTTLAHTQMRITEVTDERQSEGQQTDTFDRSAKTHREVVELVAGNVYFKGDAWVLETYTSLSKAMSTRLANKWLLIPKINPDYTYFLQGMTIHSMMTILTMTNVVRNISEVTATGQREEVLQGTSVASSFNVAYAETLSYTNSTMPLPLQATQLLEGTRGTYVFSHWNESLQFVAPKVTFVFK